MAKKGSNPADAVLQAVDQAFQAQAGRDKIAELVEELSTTAGRLRGAVDDLRPASAEEVRELRADVRALTRRVKALETASTPAAAPSKRAAAKRSTAKTPAKKPAGRGSTAAKAGAAQRAASERSAGRRTTKRTSS